VYKDNENKGHPVGLRSGRSGPDNSAFGLLHAQLDHNVHEHTIAEVIANNAAGIFQAGTRYLYGLRYELADKQLIAVEVIEERGPSESAPDKDPLGVVTAYCKDLPRCPDGVDQSL
jgi:hypothetical protein